MGTPNLKLSEVILDDIEAARAALTARGVHLGEIRSPVPGVFVCDGVDPEGNEFSIDAHS